MSSTAADPVKEMEEFRAGTDRMYGDGVGWRFEMSPYDVSPSPASGKAYSRRKSDRQQPSGSSPAPASGPCSRTAKPNHPRSSANATSWNLVDDPEVKRQRRIVKYKAYTVESKMKASLRRGFRWVKDKYSELVHGY